jgi:hypothetical protein
MWFQVRCSASVIRVRSREASSACAAGLCLRQIWKRTKSAFPASFDGLRMRAGIQGHIFWSSKWRECSGRDLCSSPLDPCLRGGRGSREPLPGDVKHRRDLAFRPVLTAWDACLPPLAGDRRRGLQKEAGDAGWPCVVGIRSLWERLPVETRNAASCVPVAVVLRRPRTGRCFTPLTLFAGGVQAGRVQCPDPVIFPAFAAISCWRG